MLSHRVYPVMKLIDGRPCLKVECWQESFALGNAKQRSLISLIDLGCWSQNETYYFQSVQDYLLWSWHVGGVDFEDFTTKQQAVVLSWLQKTKTFI